MSSWGCARVSTTEWMRAQGPTKRDYRLWDQKSKLFTRGGCFSQLRSVEVIEDAVDDLLLDAEVVGDDFGG